MCISRFIFLHRWVGGISPETIEKVGLVISETAPTVYLFLLRSWQIFDFMNSNKHIMHSVVE